MPVDRLADVLSALNELLEDPTIPKNVKSRIQSTIHALKEDKDISLRVNTALNELDELTDDSNIEAYTRTQLWNIVSMLEMI